MIKQHFSVLAVCASWAQSKTFPSFLTLVCSLGCAPIVSFSPGINCTEVYPETEFLLILEGVTGLWRNALLLWGEAEWICFYLISWPDSLWPWIKGWTSPGIGKLYIWTSHPQFCSHWRQWTPPKLLSSLKQFLLYRTILYILQM